MTVPKSKKRLRLSLALLIVVGLTVGGFLAFDRLNETSPVDPPATVTPEDLYQVNYIGLNGDIILEDFVTAGALIELPEAPRLEGYTFKEWQGNLGPIQGDREILAIYHSIPLIIGPDILTIDLNKDYDILSAFEFTDAADGDISLDNVDMTNNGVIESSGESNLILTVTNSQGETSTKNITVIAYQQPPIIEGINDAFITKGESFNVLDGITASDRIDGDLTDKVIVSGSVNTEQIGLHELTYSVTNEGGITQTITRYVQVGENIDGLNLFASEFNRFQFYVQEGVSLNLSEFDDTATSVLDLPIPVRDGYIFEGWQASASLLTPNDQLVDESYILRASWLKDEFGYAIFKDQRLFYDIELTADDYYGNVDLGMIEDIGYDELLPDPDNQYAYIFSLDSFVTDFEIPSLIHNRYVNGLYLRYDSLRLTGEEVGLKFYDNLISISIPRTLNGPVVLSALNLQSIEVNPDNATYTVVDDVLYSKDMEVIYLYPQNKSNEVFMLPDSVKIIISHAFYNVKNMVTLTTSETSSLSVLEPYSLFSFQHLEEIIFPLVVEPFVERALAFNNRLESVSYHD